jgi:hypothetical protein
MPEWWDGDKDTDNGRESDNGGGAGCPLTLAVVLAFVAALLWFLAGA